MLRHAADWALEEDFLHWLREENRFCNTLVDRIVTGYPAAQAPRLNAENGYEDALLDTAELRAVGHRGRRGPEPGVSRPKGGAAGEVRGGPPSYKEQKVRILNGGHTSMVLAAYLAGHNIVRECMEDEAVRAYLEGALFQEIIPTLSLPREDCEAFARAVEERFANPYIDHRLLDIALNSVSKWRARVLPSVTAYLEKTGRLPVVKVFTGNTNQP